MRKIILPILFVLFLTFSEFVYSIDNIETKFGQLINARFTSQWMDAPQEKIYVQTDKPYYSAGEDLWFKGYLVNETTLEPTTLSQFIYVELSDKKDSVFYRVKIKRNSFGFDGHLKLKSELPSGNYTLRAYTTWMQNLPTDFFFTKSILIGNEIDEKVISKITYGTPQNGLVPVSVSFTDATKNPIIGKKIEIVQSGSSLFKKKMVLITNTDGSVKWNLSVDPNDRTLKSIRVLQSDIKYNNTFFLPEFSSDFDVQFFPESGVFLNNNLQSIAFKAIGRDGLSVDVTGKIYNDKNEEISEFSTLHKGMGRFSIQTEPNKTYYALVQPKNGIEKRFELPKTDANAIAIHLVYNRGKILYEIVNQSGAPDKSLYLLVHCRGKVYVIQPVKFLQGQISETLLPSGIVSFSVIDSLGHTYCERLSFIRNNSFPVISMKSDKSIYGKREAVNLSMNILSKTGLPVTGNYSVSITDNHIVKADSMADNILSNLLLTSDLKGYIEDPAAYFADNSATTRERTDILMMTQGWHRFKTSDIVNGVTKKPAYYLEAGQALSGKVVNFFSKPSKKSEIILFSGYKSTIRTTKTDSTGHYLIDGIEFPDSTSFVLKAKKHGSLTDVEIIPDKDDFPKPGISIPIPLNKDYAIQDKYFEESKVKYFLDGGMPSINLKEITVKAQKKPDAHKEYYSGMADNEITSEQLDKFPSMTILNFLYTIPGINISGNKISIRGSLHSPLILVDNIEMQNLDDISYLTSFDVENIQVFKGVSAAIFGSRGGSGVIAIELKKGSSIYKETSPISLVHIVPLGYQKPAQFYVPKYEVDSILKNPHPDLRTTIYWNPQLVSDSTGAVHVKFYTADKETTYSVIMEGITETGEICRYVGVLKREGN